MNKIWIVTAGTHSDYRIVSVFSSKDIAEKFAAKDQERNVEEYEIDLYIEQIRAGLQFYSVCMYRSGEGRATLRDPNDQRELALTPRSKGKDSLLVGYTWAESEQHALKIANEKRVQLIANDEWPIGARDSK